jgi:hypothetical protein
LNSGALKTSRPGRGEGEGEGVATRGVGVAWLSRYT